MKLFLPAEAPRRWKISETTARTKNFLTERLCRGNFSVNLYL